MSHAERVLTCIRQWPGLTDREIAERLQGKGTAQQATNQACRQLEKRGLVARSTRGDGLIGNYPRDGNLQRRAPAPRPGPEVAEQPREAAPLGASPAVERLAGGCRLQWLDAGEIALAGDAVVMPRLGEGPGLYRFRFPQSRESYIGETTNLRRRLYLYANPGPAQTTNLRMRERFRQAAEAGHAVHLGLSGSVEIEIDGEAIRPDLGDKATRCLLENLAILAERGRGWRMLNR